MKQLKVERKLVLFDTAHYRTDDAAIVDHMKTVLETNNPDLLLLALGDIACAQWRRA